MVFRTILKKISVILLVCFVIFVPLAIVFGQVPFGGTVVDVFFCVNGVWFVNGITGIPGTYMYLYGASVSPFLSGPISHPGQNNVGWATGPAPCLVPCPLSGLCVIAFGLALMPIHGTSF